MVDLGTLPGHEESTAADVSGDGSLAVGTSFGAGASAAFLWDQTHGMRSLSEVLAGLGVDTNGWALLEATAISADGLTIVGVGVAPSGQSVGWVATVPEPAVLLWLGLTGLLLSRRRTKHDASADRAPRRSPTAANPQRRRT